MATIRLHPDFRDFLKLLNSARVEYLLIGGYAVGYYGYSRATMDMDVWIALSPINAKKAADVLIRFGFPAASVDEAAFLDKTRAECRQAGRLHHRDYASATLSFTFKHDFDASALPGPACRLHARASCVYCVV